MRFSALNTKHLLLFTFLLQYAFCYSQAPATCTAAIGSPANGATHYLNITWSAVGGATGYELECSTNGTTWSNIYTGSALTYAHNTGAIGNKPYYYQVRSVTGGTPSTWKSATPYPIYSACDVPALPLLSNAQPFTLTLAIQPESPDTNPAYTTYSVYCTTTSQYVQANGSLGASEVFQTRATWGSVTVTGLTASTSYCFYAKAKNMDGDVRMGSGSAISSVQQFNSNVLVNSNPSTSQWYAPNSNTPLAYNATGGCTGGMIKYSGSFNNYWGNFVRMPQQNCTGNTSVVLNFDISHSYFAAHVQPSPSNSDAIRFYMWVDNGYKPASSVKIGGVDVTSVDGNGCWLKYDVLRTCVNVSVTFDLTTSSDLSNILFYLEPNCSFNNSNVFSTVLDNISIQSSAAPTACLSTTACTAATIPNNPANQTKCVGENTSFSITTSGGVSGIQWQVNNGGGWLPATGGIYSNENTTTLTLTGVTANLSGYQYRASVTGACSGNPVSNAATLTVNALPGAASTIISASGATVCQNQASVAYSVNSVSGATGYNWSLPVGASIASGSNTATITVNYAANAQAGNIVVTPTNTCGNGTASTPFAVTVNTIPVITTAIGGSTAVCEFFDETYSISPVAGATGYTWSLPLGWIGLQNGTSITATAANAGGNVVVTADNGCGTSAPQSLTVTVTPLPDMPTVITGSGYACEFSSANTYSVAPVAGATGYTWTLPNGFTGSSTSTSIDITVGNTSGQIEVTAENACGSSVPQTKGISVLGAPDMPGAITGPAQACTGDTVTFSITAVGGATGYEWSGPLSEVIGPENLTFTFITQVTGVNVTVATRGLCGTSAESVKTLIVNALPTVEFTMPQGTYCQNASAITLSGGTPVGGFYTGLAVDNNNSFDPSLLAAPANYILQYDYTDANGCHSYDTTAVAIAICSGIQDITEATLVVYPNPFSHQLTIQLSSITANTTAILFDIAGRELQRTIITSNQFNWNLAQLSKGIYTLTILEEGHTIATKKLVKAE